MIALQAAKLKTGRDRRPVRRTLSERRRHHKPEVRVAAAPIHANCAKRNVTQEPGWSWRKRYVAPEVTVTVAGTDKSMSQTTQKEVLEKLRRRYRNAGAEHKRQLLDQAQELLGCHRKAALLERWLRPIWAGTDYACRRRLVAMLPEWIPAYEAYERRVPAEAREKLLAASARTLNRLLDSLRGRGGGRTLTRPGTLLRQQIPIRGSVWGEGQAGWLEVDTVALCGGSVAGEFVWLLDGVDYATTWVEVRAMWGRGQAGTLAALREVEANLPFPQE